MSKVTCLSQRVLNRVTGPQGKWCMTKVCALYSVQMSSSGTMFELQSFLRNSLPFRFKMLVAVVTTLIFSRCTTEEAVFRMHFALSTELV